MATVQFISSPHGISKRFRLNSDLPRNAFQEIDEILHPVVKEELQKIESNKDCNSTNVLLKSDKLKDCHNDSCLFSVMDRCMDAFMEHSALPLGKVYNKTKEKEILTSKETEHNIVGKQTCNLGNDLSARVLKKSNEISFNIIDHQSRIESTRTLLVVHHYKSLNKDKTELSVDSEKKCVNEICENLKDSTKVEKISVEKSTNLFTYKDKKSNEVLKNDKLKSIPQECNRNMRISEELHEAEFHNGGIYLEDKNNFSLQNNGKIPDSLKTLKLDHILIGTLKECNNSEITVKNVKNLKESKLEAEKSLEGYKIENTSLEQDKPKSKLHSDDYKMFSKVIQRARNKVKPRTRPNKPSISVEEEKEQSRKNLYTFEKLGECSKMGKESYYKSKLTRVLYDMSEVEEFLSFWGDDLAQMLSHFSAVSEILKFLSWAAENIEIDIEKVQCYKEIFADQNRRSTDEYFQTAAGAYAEFEKLGESLLNNIIEQGKIWGRSLNKYKMSLDLVADTTWKFCSMSIEDKLFDGRDFIYAVFEELKTQVFSVQKIQKEVQDLYNTESMKIWDIREYIHKLKHTSNKLPY